MLILKIIYLSSLLSLILVSNGSAKLQKSTPFTNLKSSDLKTANDTQHNPSQLTSIISTPKDNIWIIDRIIALVNGVRILQSDTKKPRIAKEGKNYTLDETIMEELLVQRAAERHCIPSETEIERQVTAFKIQNGMGNLSDTEFEEQLKQFGFSLKEYKNQMARLIASENIKRMEVIDKIVITSQDVEDYFKKNPEKTPEEFHLKMIPVEKELDKQIKLNKSETVDLGWIKKNDLDEKFKFVLNMKKGEQSDIITINDKKYVIEITDKKESRMKTLDERYREIEQQLIQQKKGKLIKTFETNLKKNASIALYTKTK